MISETSILTLHEISEKWCRVEIMLSTMMIIYDLKYEFSLFSNK